MKNVKHLVHAVPGTMVVWFNHCLQKTKVEPVLFWGCEEVDGDSFVVPFTINELGGFASELDMPERDFPKDDPRHDGESQIIAYDIPGWGRLYLSEDVGPSAYCQTATGFSPDLTWRKGGEQ